MLRTIAPLFAPQVVAFTLVFGATQAAEAGLLGDAWRPADNGRAVEWGGVMHSSPEELRAWLAERGVGYERWARRHPAASVQLERAAEARAASRRADSIVPLETSTLVFLAFALASVSLLAANARLPRGVRRTGGIPAGAKRPAGTRHGLVSRPVGPALPAAAANHGAAPHLRRPPPAPPAPSAPAGRKTRAPAVALALTYRRFDVAFWGAGIAASVFVALLAARLL